MPNSKISFSVNSMVRLAPMPVPTYGRLSLRSFSAFVPYTDLLETFGHFLASKPYTGAGSGVYTPTSLPQCAVNFFLMALWQNSYMTVYVRNGSTTTYQPVATTNTATLATAKSQLEADFRAWYGYDSNPFTFHTPSTDFMSYRQHIPFKPIKSAGADQIIVSQSGSYMYCIKFNTHGKRLVKILRNLGYSISITDTTLVSLMPLFAYYKAWFDLMKPQRMQGEIWEVSSAYYILNYCAQYNESNPFYFGDESRYDALIDFLADDLPMCFYNYDTDYISAHIANTATASTGTASIDTISPDGSKYHQFNSLEKQPSVTLDSTSLLDKISIDAAIRLTRFVNKSTAIGSNVSKLVKSLFGVSSDHIQDCKLLHSDKLDINIGEVFNTGGDPGESLGDYAGRGVGHNNGSTCTYEARDFGCIITFVAIVPRSSFTQGLDYNLLHIDKHTMPTPDFDSLGFQISNKNVVFNQYDCVNMNHRPQTGLPFGYIPRYFETKVQQSRISGDMSIRSLRTSFLPYTLDKFISPDELAITEDTSPNLTYNPNGSADAQTYIPPASTVWLSCGSFPALSNFNRIFNNSGVVANQY